MPPTGDLAGNPDMGPDWESNQQPFDLQAGTQYTELHQPGLKSFHKTISFNSHSALKVDFIIFLIFFQVQKEDKWLAQGNLIWGQTWIQVICF